MRFRASLLAMRRISWIDQRISGGVIMFRLLPRFGASFLRRPFARRRIAAIMGEGEHHQRHMTQYRPVRQASALVVIEAELVLWRSQNCPRSPSDDPRPPPTFESRCSRRTPSGKKGEIAIGDVVADRAGDVSTDHQLRCRFLLDLKIGETEITPVMQPRSFGSGSRRQSLPIGGGAAPGRYLPLCRQLIAACPGSET